MEATIVEGGMDNQIRTTSKVAVDMSKFLATRSIKMAGQGVMEDDSNMFKVRIHLMLAIGWF